jgi:hypothetical protein
VVWGSVSVSEEWNELWCGWRNDERSAGVVWGSVSVSEEWNELWCGWRNEREVLLGEGK